MTSTLPRPKYIYAIFGLVFGICFPLIVLIQNFPASLFNAEKAPALVKGYFIIFVVYVVWNIWSLIIGSLVGMLVGLLIERVMRSRKINPLVASGLGGLIWAAAMSIVVLGIPTVLVIIVFSLVGQNAFLSVLFVAFGVFALIAGIVLIVPFSIVGFILSVTFAQLLAKRSEPKTYHFLLTAGGIAAICCVLALMLKVIANII
jgi:hypothetical protein